VEKMKKIKKILSVFLAAVLTLGITAAAPMVNADTEAPKLSFNADKALYVHAVSSSEDVEAWSAWQCVHGRDYKEINPDEKFFFLPSSADSSKVDIFNNFTENVNVNGTEIPAGKVTEVNYEQDKTYEVKAENETYKLRFMKSEAEAAVYVNNSDADGKGTDLFTYLSDEKSNTAKAAGAIVSPDGKVDNTSIKKIKGRGNTTWNMDKKPFNITYDKKVSVAGMKEGKKYSLLANFQDDTLSRNRILYDLSDAVDMPYASDSRYVDFYMNGYYWGTYQMAEKIEVGKNSLISDFEETDYLNEDGSVKEDFPFLCEVDPGAQVAYDYFVTLDDGLKITIKSPEIAQGEKGYNTVKNYVKEKFTELCGALGTNDEKLKDIADVDSVAKLYLINELGKNWDAGVSSMFFTYKQDENGKYKFYGSPVWDYDNSLGNAAGIKEMLDYFAIYDYEKPTGEWGSFAMDFISNEVLLNRIKEIWFEKFVPAIDHFTGKKFNSNMDKVFHTKDKYFSLVEKSAAMNYACGWPTYTGEWIADHTSLTKLSYDSETNTYSVNKYPTSYPDTFKGKFDYACDWMVSRAAWLSKEYSAEQVNEIEVNNEEDLPPVVEPENPVGKKTPAISAKSLSLKAGEAKVLKVTNASVKSWKSSNAKAVSVKGGKVTALKKGSAEITATLTDGGKLTCKVTVKTSPKLSKKSITVKVKKTKAVKIIGKADGFNNKYKNTKTAKVTSKKSAKSLKIKGLKKGKTTLKITVNGVKLKLKVKVK
jgi:hypothetical protein